MGFSIFVVISSLLAMTQVAFGVAVSHSRQGMLDHLGTGWAKRRAGSENSNSGNHSARQDSDETVLNCHSFLEKQEGYTHMPSFWIQTDPTSSGGGFPKAPWHTTSPTPADSASWAIPYRLLEAWKAHRAHLPGVMSWVLYLYLSPVNSTFLERVWTTMRTHQNVMFDPFTPTNWICPTIGASQNPVVFSTIPRMKKIDKCWNCFSRQTRKVEIDRSAESPYP